ncbi:MAG TPA: transglycosylase SLT domain-containing protein [Fibrobacteria bacterium]|nr:transglycosylase SLT domain-containing protein [Fibrobacteria bacterium]
MADYFLQIISGVQVGRKIRIADGVTLGRNPENTVCFSGPDGTLVSGNHAVIEKRGEILMLRDLGSTNGTFINGTQIAEHALNLDEVISLGVSGPKMRLVERSVSAGDSTTMKPVGNPALGVSSQEPRQLHTEYEGKRSPGKSSAPPGFFKSKGLASGKAPAKGPPPSKGGRDFGTGGGDDENAGNYTMGLAQRLKDDEAGNDELQELIKDKNRAQRLVKSGMLSKRDAMMIHSAASMHSSQKKKALLILGSVSLAAFIIVSVLLYQNMGYRGKLKQQETLLSNVRNLESQITSAPAAADADEHEKAVLVAKLRAAERQLMSVRSNLKSSDIINTYKNPLGREIHTILEGFGKRDYIVPDIFIKQVEKHIYTFTKTSTRNIMDRSFANSHKYKYLIEEELTRQGMPLAFYYLAMHESLLDSNIISRAGARGLWQFMPQTARDYGLKVPEGWENLPAESDQRTNPRLATQAGVKYVKTLYAEFGDVALAMAAYNAGEGRIRKALRSIDDPINNRDFWYIYRLGTLADETNEYVPKIIATMIIDKNRSRYGFPP